MSRLGRLFTKKSKKKSKAKGDDEEDDNEHATKAVMWLRDLLVPAFSSARVATYSYGSDWRDRRVNTSLRECGQQLLKVLLQHRQSPDVCFVFSLVKLCILTRTRQERQRPLIFIRP